MTILTSRDGVLEFGPGLPTLLINDQLRVMDQVPEVLSELREGRIDRMLDLARWGKQVGLEMVDILINHTDLDEVSLLPKIAAAVHTEIGCPVSLDAIRRCWKQPWRSQPYKALINSVTAEMITGNPSPIAKIWGGCDRNADRPPAPIAEDRGGRLEEASVIIAG
jgi:hypothetical protein